ncbi:MAG: acetylglutamate kinase [Proteobacteria bacterium]|nr:acetylglutamate kinase [Pseudomonadota bacterium]
MQTPASELWVIKIGGAMVDDAAAARSLLRQVRECVAAGIRVVLVHGGGQRLTSVAERLGHTSTFVGGRRVTDAGMIEVAKLVFAGGVGTDLAAVAHGEGVSAVALSGVAAGLLQVQRRPPRNGVDFGWVGDVTAVDPKVLLALTSNGFVPMVASLGVDDDGLVYNVNADTVACAIAVGLRASRLMVMTALDGVLRDPSDPQSRVPRLNISHIRSGCLDFAISGGMIPKLESLAAAREQGVGQVLLASWHHPDGLTSWIHAESPYGTQLV